MPGNGGDVFRDEIIALERASLDALKSGDLAAFGNMLSDDALIVDAHGSVSKPEELKRFAAIRLKDYTMTGVRFVPVSAEGGLVTYMLTGTGTAQGKEVAVHEQISAVWERNGRDWLCVFFQVSER
jgi:ketosteroid isomerase-like protein